MRKTPQAAWTILEDMVASSCQYTTDRPTLASAATIEDNITNILQLDSITHLSSQIKTFNKNFANLNLVAVVNSFGISHGNKQSEELCPAEEQPQYLESSNQDEEAVIYVNPQWGDKQQSKMKPSQSEQPELPKYLLEKQQPVSSGTSNYPTQATV
ncbi:hypothetical protein Dimus_015301 [Dionaea muscipula]